MQVKDFRMMLAQRGVTRISWNDEITAAVAVLIGNAQAKGFLYGVLAGFLVSLIFMHLSSI
jgi:hypothetical protein